MAAPNPSPGQLWTCNGCGLVAEWHPAEEGGYYCHCDCQARYRAGMTFVGYEAGYGPKGEVQTSTQGGEAS